jgi:large subunit ribosomal protein L35
VKSEPKVKYLNADHDSGYTLMMVDPDAPSRDNPIKRSWLHWLVINIKGHETSHGETKCRFYEPSFRPKFLFVNFYSRIVNKNLTHIG